MTRRVSFLMKKQRRSDNTFWTTLITDDFIIRSSWILSQFIQSYQRSWMLSRKKEMRIKRQFTSSNDFEERKNTIMQLINRLRFFETWKKSSLKIDSFTTSWRSWAKRSNIDWKIQTETYERKQRRRTTIKLR